MKSRKRGRAAPRPLFFITGAFPSLRQKRSKLVAGRGAACAILGVDGGFAGRRDVFAAGAFQDLLGAGDFVRTGAVDREKDSALLDQAFVALGFKFRNACADKSAG